MKTGILVPSKDTEAMEDAVSLLIGNKELPSRLGRVAQDRVEQMYLPDQYARAVSDRLQSVK